MSLPPADPLAPHADGLRAALPTPEQIYRRARLRRRGRALACAFALGLGVTGTVWLNPTYRSDHFFTALGERARWNLPDGSQVALNTGTRLDMRYRLRSREFVLHEGEALFTVADSRVRRFIVDTPHGRVEDLGTAFNLRTSAEGARVDVLEGRVRVTMPGTSPLELAVGQAASLSAGAAWQARPGSAGAGAWREGRLVFDRTRLADVVAELQRYRAEPVRLLAPGLEELPISGQFDIARLDRLPELLATLAPLTVRRLPDGAVELREKP